MSVATDVNGWTVVTPSDDSRIIYVSTAGSDANDGISPAAPVATADRARALARSGFPDQILFRRGDTFVGQSLATWNLSGRDGDEPFVIGAYTDPARPSAQRPKLATGIGNGIGFTTTVPVSHVYVLGVAFEAHSRNYREPPGNDGGGFTTAVRPDAQGGTYGLRVLGETHDLHVEDCSFQYYRTNVSLQTTPGAGGVERAVTDVTLRRNQILDAYAPNVDQFGIVFEFPAIGVYAGGYVDGLTIDGNVLSHNGWTADNALGAVASIYSHNAYINTNVSGLVFTNNVVADAASHGLQARPGGIVKDNLFLRNPIAMSYGYVNGAVRAGGVSGEISGNVVVGTGRILEAGRGWGLEISNLKPAGAGGGTVIRNNVYANDLATGGEHAIKLDIGSVSNPSDDVGINDLTVEGNVVYSWGRGMMVAGGFNNPNHSRYRPLNNLVVRGNDFQRLFVGSGSGPIVDHAAPFTPSAEAWADNRYDGTKVDDNGTRWFRMAGTLKTFDEWKAAYEPTAMRALGAFPDPGRTAGDYNASLGGANSTDAFVEEARRQSRAFWRPALVSGAANAYIRAGYSGGRIDTAAPTASADAENVTVAGAGRHTFTVTYSDDNRLDLATLGSGDVRVVGPNGYSAAASFVSSTGNVEGDRRVATYHVDAPGGAWSADANGLYSVVVEPDAVRDAAGRPAAADPIGSFSVAIDPAVPGATVTSAPDVVRDDGPALVTVTYSGGPSPGLPTTVSPMNAGFETPNVGAGQGAFQQAPAGASWTFEGGAGISGNSSLYTASNPPAPQGGQVAFIESSGTMSQRVDDWPEGEFAISFQAAQRGSNSMPQQIRVEVDGAAVATLTPAGTTYQTYTTAAFTAGKGEHVVRFVGLVTAGGTNTVLLDDVRIAGETTPSRQWIDADTLGAADLRLSGPNGYGAGATAAAVDQPGVDGPQRVVTYTVPAPAGGWSGVAGGATWYAAHVVEGEVLTTTGVAVPAAKVGAVRVTIDAPTATVSAANVTAGSTAAHAFTVTYVDAGGTGGGGGLAPGIDSADLRVTGPGGFDAPVTLGGFSGAGTTASPLVATYAVAPPPKGWSDAANGTYTIVAQANQVTDADGNSLRAGAIGQFRVAIDATAPLAWSSEEPIVSPTPLGATPAGKPVVVSYSDVSGINLSTLDGNDISVTGPNGFAQMLSRGAVTSKPTAATVTYVLAPPAGGWKSRHNGAYAVNLMPRQVFDNAGNSLAAARQVTTINVNLETVAPTAAITAVAPDPRAAPVTGLTFTFNEVVTGVDLADLSLTRNGSSVPLAGATLSTTDNRTYTLGGLSNHTGPAGSYTLTVVAAGSGVEDLAGNAMVANAVETWVNDQAPPQVAAVFVGSTAWAPGFNNFLQGSGAGEAAYGFRVDAADQLNELPWTNLNKVSIRFTEAAVVQQGSLVVRGASMAAYAFGGALPFTYDAATFTATWTLATPGVGAERLTLDLDADTALAVTDLAGNPLDGEWTDPLDPAVSGDAFPSGNGTAGGDFRFRVHVLAGDANRNGAVQGTDVNLVRAAIGASPGGAAYSIFKDVDGSGSVRNIDMALVRERQGATLPPPAAIRTTGGLRAEPTHTASAPAPAAPTRTDVPARTSPTAPATRTAGSAPAAPLAPPLAGLVPGVDRKRLGGPST